MEKQDLRMLLRLVALHEKKVEVDKDVRVYVSGQENKFKCISHVDIGRNVKCLMMKQMTGTAGGGTARLVLAFSWFSPRGVWDWAGLGYSLASSSVPSGAMVSPVYSDLAASFLEDGRGLKERLREEVAACCGASEGLELILTGFSLGGAVAYAMAYQLLETHRLVDQKAEAIRVVAFGSGRVGSEEFSSWCASNLRADSATVMIKAPPDSSTTAAAAVEESYDLACLAPPLSAGFGIQPFPRVLSMGRTAPLTPAETDEIRSLDLQAATSAMGRMVSMSRSSGGPLHSVSRYYEELAQPT
eukprot:GHVU01193834.1.p1 GENE.GHVU01193834.1~~GHVU01193834.1.p1  ORF type:complete len:301 (+),score=48.45 GHVU01193834.1:157-1059(+)